MKVLVVGHGVMGKNHVRVLEAMGHLVETLDPSLDSGAAHHMLTEDLIARTDVVCVATPIDNLATVAAAWLERGKDVLVEKPGALTAADLSLDRRHAASLGRRLFVGYTERFNPAVQVLADHLHRVGHVRHIHVRRLGYAADRGGDPALDLATHDLDVLDALGFELSMERVVHTGQHVAALLTADHVLGSCTASALIEASHLYPSKVRELEVVGDDGVLRLDYQAQTLDLLTGDLRTALFVRKAEPLQREWEAFFNGDGSTGIAALAIAEQMADAAVLAPTA